MELTRTCRHGHQWQALPGAPSGDDSSNEACPVCGAWAETLVPDTLDPSGLASPSRGSSSATPYVSPHAALPEVPGYLIESELGRGGMGVVFRARQLSLQRTVALKMLASGPLASSAALARFRTEAESVARLAHTNIVQIFEVGATAGHAFFSLEYVDGGTLADRAGHEPRAAREAAQLVATLARAVQYAHDQGVVHRDLKPANVLLTADGTPKIADFGLAKQLADQSHQTHTGDVMGSPSYMAPEQARGATHQIGPACDIYALGAILYELLTGRPPFLGQDSMETVLQVINEEPLPPRRLLPSVPRDLETICLKCLQKLPRTRYASATALADDLQRYLGGLPILARPVGPVELLLKWARRRPAVAALLIVSFGAAATIITYGAWKNSQLDKANEQLFFANTQLTDTLTAEQAQRERAEKNFRKALDAADRRLNRAGQDPLRLLVEELEFYDEIRQQPGDSAEIRYEKAMADRRAGDIHRMLGNTEPAQEAYLEAIGLLGVLAAADPNVDYYRRDLAAAHNGLAQLWEAAGRLSESEQQYRAGLHLFEQLSAEYPAEFDFRRQQGVLWNNLAIQLVHAGRKPEAEESYQKSLALRRKLREDFPQDPQCRLDQSITQANLAVFYSNSGRFDEAEKSLGEALQLRESLPDSITAEAEFRAATAKLYNNLGAARARSRNAQAAVTAYERAIGMLDRLIADYPAVPQHRKMLAETQTNLGLHLAANGMPDKAAAAFAAALAIWEKLANDDPNTKAYTDNAERARLFLKEILAPAPGVAPPPL